MEDKSSAPCRKTGELHAHRWSAAGARYFITCCTQARCAGLVSNGVGSALLAAVKASDAYGDTATIAFTAMPDHVHWLFALGQRLSLGRILARFKTQTRIHLTSHGLSWQRDFFEHRLRPDESAEDYALYIFLNPYRSGHAGCRWPEWWAPRPELLEFLGKLRADGSPPPEWLKLDLEVVAGEHS